MRILNAFTSLFGGGKDSFTQTEYKYYKNTYIGGKQEVWVDNSCSNLLNIYETTPQLKAIINRKANMVANGRWKHIKNGKEVDNSEVVRLLENPNPINNGNEFLRNESINNDIFGNSFIYSLSGSKLTIPKCLYVLPSELMRIETSGYIYEQTSIEDIITSYKLTENERDKKFSPQDIIHFKDSAISNPLMGQSKLVALTMPISNIRASYGFRNRIITNDAALGILSSETKEGLGMTLDKKEQERINKGYKSSFGMQEGKSNIHMTEAAVKWNAISYPTKDLMLFEEIDDDFRIIIDAFGLNDNIFSKSSGSTFENLKQGIKLAYQDCIIPFAEERALAFTKHLGMNGKDEYLTIDYSHIEILKEDEKVKAETIKQKAEAVKLLSELGREDLIETIQF